VKKIDPIRDCGHYPVQPSARAPRAAADMVPVLIEGGFRSSHGTVLDGI